MPVKYDIRGYAIVSDDDKIAAADGLTPTTLRNEKDWHYYQNAQNQADVIVFARRSHEAEPNKAHLRIVISRDSHGLEKREDGWWWNPEKVDWQKAVAEVLPGGGRVAVCGGQTAFDLFLKIGFTEFCLSHARGIFLKGGRAVFSASEHGVPADEVLKKSGLELSENILIDPVQKIEMHLWRRPR